MDIEVERCKLRQIKRDGFSGQLQFQLNCSAIILFFFISINLFQLGNFCVSLFNLYAIWLKRTAHFFYEKCRFTAFIASKYFAVVVFAPINISIN